MLVASILIMAGLLGVMIIEMEGSFPPTVCSICLQSGELYIQIKSLNDDTDDTRNMQNAILKYIATLSTYPRYIHDETI